MTQPQDDLYDALAPFRLIQRGEESTPLQFAPLEASDIPGPYRKLLAHDRDMTQTLEAFHHCTIRLKVAHAMHLESDYVREVTLHLDGSDTPVEYGIIRIFLAQFSDTMRAQILANTLPLGALINQAHFEVSHSPGPFFTVQPDAPMSDMLNMTTTRPVFGRCNMIRDTHDAPVAQVVEILPPLL